MCLRNLFQQLFHRRRRGNVVKQHDAVLDGAGFQKLFAFAAADQGAINGEEELGGDARFQLLEAAVEMAAVPAVQAFEVEGFC